MIVWSILLASNVSYDNRKSVLDKKPNQVARARSVPHKGVFVRCVILSSLHYLGILAVLATIAAFVTHPSRLATLVLVGALAFTAITWLITFFKRRCTHCPLCKGTPLIDSGALPHQKAKRLFPLNYGTTATLSIIAFQKFRCMYCGTEYDLLKPSSHKRNSEPGEYKSEYVSEYKSYSDES